MPLMITRADLERNIELLGLVVENAADLRDIADAARLQKTFHDQLTGTPLIVSPTIYDPGP